MSICLTNLNNICYKKQEGKNWKKNIIAIQNIKEDVSLEEKIDNAIGKAPAVKKESDIIRVL